MKRPYPTRALLMATGALLRPLSFYQRALALQRQYGKGRHIDMDFMKGELDAGRPPSNIMTHKR